MDYAAKHAELLRKTIDRGAPVSFTSGGASVYNEETDTWTGTSSSKTDGYAVEIPADPEMYERLSLTLIETVTLMFVPNVLGELPGQNSQVIWAGEGRAVKAVLPIRPGGTAIAAKVVAV